MLSTHRFFGTVWISPCHSASSEVCPQNLFPHQPVPQKSTASTNQISFSFNSRFNSRLLCLAKNSGMEVSWFIERTINFYFKVLWFTCSNQDWDGKWWCWGDHSFLQPVTACSRSWCYMWMTCRADPGTCQFMKQPWWSPRRLLWTLRSGGTVLLTRSWRQRNQSPDDGHCCKLLLLHQPRQWQKCFHCWGFLEESWKWRLHHPDKLDQEFSQPSADQHLNIVHILCKSCH